MNKSSTFEEKPTRTRGGRAMSYVIAISPLLAFSAFSFFIFFFLRPSFQGKWAQSLNLVIISLLYIAGISLLVGIFGGLTLAKIKRDRRWHIVSIGSIALAAVIIFLTYAGLRGLAAT